MPELRQLAMRTSLDRALPVLPELPPEMSVHSADGHERASWNWIIRAAMDPKLDYSMIENDRHCKPENVFFVRSFCMDIATATAFIDDDGSGVLHMVSTHPAWRGIGASAYAILAVMRRLKELGASCCRLTTDDFRLPAIHIYLSMGFVPDYDESDTEMVRRWAAVRQKLDEWKKPVRTPIPLWPGKTAPDTENCGDQAQPSLKPFLSESKRGAVIVCPGGGYSIKAGHEADPIARMLNMAGITSYVLDYRVKPYTSVDTPIGDALRAVRVLRASGYEKVAILGFSAGGHLAAMAATHYDNGLPGSPDPVERLSSRPDAFIPCYGATGECEYDFLDEWKHALRGNMPLSGEQRSAYCAELRVDPQTPPAFIWHTADDPVVPVENALSLARAQRK